MPDIAAGPTSTAEIVFDGAPFVFSSDLETPQDRDWIRLTFPEGPELPVTVTIQGLGDETVIMRVTRLDGMAPGDELTGYQYLNDQFFIVEGGTNDFDSIFPFYSVYSTFGATFELEAAASYWLVVRPETAVGSGEYTIAVTPELPDDNTTPAWLASGDVLFNTTAMYEEYNGVPSSDTDRIRLDLSEAGIYLLETSGRGAFETLSLVDAPDTIEFLDASRASHGGTLLFGTTEPAEIFADMTDGYDIGLQDVRLERVTAISGDSDANPLTGSHLREFLNGEDGADSLDGRGGHDTLTGGPGEDLLLGGVGWDRLLGGVGDDTLDAGAGWDQAEGGEGDDLIMGRHGFDMLWGGSGNDTLLGGFQNDSLDGEAGNDWIYGGEGADTVTGGDASDTIHGNAGADNLMGDAGDDRLLGGINFDTLRGGDGDDTVLAGDGFDSLFGDAGHDVLEGNAGNDRLNGGLGDDTMRGGLGADAFVFDANFEPNAYYLDLPVPVSGGADQVNDFQPGIDTLLIDYSLVDAPYEQRLQTVLESGRVNSEGHLTLEFEFQTITLVGVTSVDQLDGAIVFI